MTHTKQKKGIAVARKYTETPMNDEVTVIAYIVAGPYTFKV